MAKKETTKTKFHLKVKPHDVAGVKFGKQEKVFLNPLKIIRCALSAIHWENMKCFVGTIESDLQVLPVLFLF